MADKSSDMTVLFACGGRRIELIQAFRAAAKQLGVSIKIVITDGDPTAPACYVADKTELVPRITDDAYIPAMLDIVRKHNVDLLIPTIDTDLIKLSQNRDAFDTEGCKALIGPEPMIRMCRDKNLTYKFLVENGIDTPMTYSGEEIRTVENPQFPLLLKPKDGSSSKFVEKIENGEDLAYHLDRVPGAMVQEFVDGVEHTLDAYVGLTGKVRCIVPRKRLQVRAGEVSKGITIKDPAILKVGKQLAEAMGPEMRGLITLQCMVTDDGQIRFIEINPRFGGGAPLGIAAGADYPGWLIQEFLGQPPTIEFDGWEDRLCMFRYDWAVFVNENAIAKPSPIETLRPAPDFE